MQLPAATRRSAVYATVAMLAAWGFVLAAQKGSATPSTTRAQKPVPAQVSAPSAAEALNAFQVTPEAWLSPGETGSLEVQSLASAAPRSNAPAMAASSAGRAADVQARPKVTVYTVVSGDSVEAIAARFNLKIETVLWANEMDADDLLSIGQELMVPAADGLVRKVHIGDTLWDIALEHEADVDEIVQANPDIEPGALQPGQVLLIPGGQPATRRQLASRGVSRAGTSGRFEFWPTVGLLTDQFGWRIHPVYGTSHFHDGIDLDARVGTPLRAVTSGTVTFASRYGGYGLAVKIDHGRGVVTQYSHMSSIEVEVGQRVAAGEHLGYSGNTGVTTGPHLHFSLFVNSSPVDPLPWLP